MSSPATTRSPEEHKVVAVIVLPELIPLPIQTAPDTHNADRLPNEVMFVCAAVDKVPVRVVADTVVKPLTVDGSPIVIKYSDGKASGDIALPKNFTMSINDASINSLKELCGSDKVKLVYHPRPNIH